MIYVIKDNEFVIFGSVGHSITHMGSISPFKVYNEHPGFGNREEMCKWLYQKGYRAMEANDEAKVMLCLA